MFPMECLVQLTWRSCLWMSVFVYSMCVWTCWCTCACGHRSEKCCGDSWKEWLSTVKSRIVNHVCYCALFVELSPPQSAHICLLCFSHQVCSLAQKSTCWTQLNECMLFLLKFRQTVGGAFFFVFCFVQAVIHCLEWICLEYYLPLILNAILHILPM